MKLNKKNKTVLPEREKLVKKWWLIDADGMILGRLTTKVADILRGKDKPNYTPFIDTGDYVIIINAQKVKISGKKDKQKMYYRHSGYLGGLKEISYDKMIAKKPEKVIIHAVKGMLPKNRINRKILKKLKVYAGANHKHSAQRPEILKI